eukprot:g5997.t1
MIVQDYISKRFRGEKPISRRHKPKGVDSCFGNFPAQYKKQDGWDGNPTLRRDSRTSYTSPLRSPVKTRRQKGLDTKEVSGVIPGIGNRPSTAGARRRSIDRSENGTGIGAMGVTRGGRGARPKSASACRSRSFLEVKGSSTGAASFSRSETRERKKGEGGRGEGLASTYPEKSRKARARPQTAGPTPTSRGRPGTVREDLPDREELEATRNYLLTQGKFRITPSKLMASLEVARATNSRPLSAPPGLRRRRAPAPPKAAATLFRKYYVRADLPISVDHAGHRNAIRWKIRPAELDFHVYLPIFFDGLREVEDPYRFLAVQGALDMIESAPDKVLPVIPQLILPMKIALNTREPRIICPTLKILQQMILLSPMVGQALVPYYRQLLPVFNLFRGKNSNMGDAIDYNQRSRTNLGELILETLEVMEQFGGPDAFINIKYMVPTVSSCPGRSEAMADCKLAAASAGASSLRCRRRGRGEDESEQKLSLLSAPPEVMSVIMLLLDGAALAQASCVSKVLQAVITVDHWESAARRARWLQSPTPSRSSFESPEEAERYWRRWSKLAPTDDDSSGVPSGRVVVIGGNEITSTEASVTAEAFPDVRYGETVTWEIFPSMAVPRSAAGATADRNGNLFALGGWNDHGALAACERLTRSNNLPAAAAAAAGSQEPPQCQHGRSIAVEETCAADEPSGFNSSGGFGGGGGGGSASTAQLPPINPGPLDLASTSPPAAAVQDWRWETLPPLQRPRCFLGAAFEASGALLAVGGGTGPYRNASAFETVEMLLPGATSWVPGPSMAEARCGLGVTAVADGKIFAVGGYGGNLAYLSSAEVLDPCSGQWASLAPMKRRRTGVAVAAGPCGRLYAVGGSSNGSHGLSSVETFDPREGKWGSSPRMIFGRAYCCASFAASGCLYVLGGTSVPAGVLRTVEVFDPRAERWRVEERFGARDGRRQLTDACLVFQPPP